VQPLKELCVDHRAIGAVVILSDANAALSLPHDPQRRQLVWVGEFTQAEADAYFDKQEQQLPFSRPFSRVLRQRLYDSIDRQPLTLWDFCWKLQKAKCSTDMACTEQVLTRYIAEAQRGASHSRSTLRPPRASAPSPIF
jgi:hypothetical protein